MTGAAGKPEAMTAGNRRAGAVAVLGLGAMGLPMATRLVEAIPGPVTAFDVAAERRQLAERAGAAGCASAAEAVDAAAVAVVAVRDGAQAESTLFGPAGAVETLAPDCVVVLTSTIGPDAARTLAARLAEHAIRLLDAPVSGGPARAGTGDLLIVAGADDRTVADGRQVLDALGSAVHIVGGAPGDGQTMKIVNQLLCGIHTAAAAEALGLAHRLGLDVARVLEILGQGAAASFMLGDRGARMAEIVAGGQPALRSRVDVIAKDMGLVAQVAAGVGMPTPLAGAADQLYRLAMAHGMAAADDSYLVTLLDRQGD